MVTQVLCVFPDRHTCSVYRNSVGFLKLGSFRNTKQIVCIFNPLTAGAEYIGVFSLHYYTFTDSVPPFKHVKAIM